MKITTVAKYKDGKEWESPEQTPIMESTKFELDRPKMYVTKLFARPFLSLEEENISIIPPSEKKHFELKHIEVIYHYEEA